MEKIRRFDYYFAAGLYCNEAGMELSELGGYVIYEDHERIVKELEEKLKAYQETLSLQEVVHQNGASRSYDLGFRDGIDACRSDTDRF